MSAFAAIVALDGRPASCQLDSDGVSAALSAVSGTPAGHWRSGACELLSAPIHPWEAPGPVSVGDGRLAVAGQVMLEGRSDLAHALQLPQNSPDLSVVVTAFDRWGVPHADHLHGEYAYAVWDSRDRRLICARDPFGIRAMYVGSTNRAIVISNVIDAVVAHPDVSDEVDSSALTRFLASGRLTTTVATPYRAVRMLPEGHTLTVDSHGRVALARHWQPPPTQRCREQSAAFFVSGYREVLRRAVQERIGGRRCTIFLSGGMDSTSLAVLGAECASDIRAVTFAFQRFHNPDEVSLARSVAERLSLRLDVVPGDADIALEAERNGDGPAVPVDEPSLSNWRAGLRAAASFSSLAVYGEDGDALFSSPGGAALLSAQPVPSVLRAILISLVTHGRLPYLGIRLRERLRLSTAPRDVATPWLAPVVRRLAELPEEPEILGQRLQTVDIDPCNGRTWERLLRNVPQAFAISISPDVTRQRLALTLPLMDTRVIEFVMSVPPIPWCQDKRLSRAAFAGALPSAVLTRRKTPAVDLHATLVESWRSRYLPAALASIAPAMAETGWVDGGQWAAAVERGTPDVTLAALRIVLLDAWLSRTSRGVACTV